MRRRLSVVVVAVIAAVAGPVIADDEADPEVDGADFPDRALGASLGAAIGGGSTAGGLRLAVDYLYQMNDTDWFDGGLAFTWGPTDAECFRDRQDVLVCDHGAADGGAIQLRAGVRRFGRVQQGFRPWARPSVALRLVRFGPDDLTGVGPVAEAAVGVRARVHEVVSVGGMAALEAGAAWFNRDHGLALQLGLVIGATVDFALP